MNRIALALLAVLAITTCFPYSSYAQQPWDAIVDWPTEMIVDEEYTLRIYLQNNSGNYTTTNGGYLDVSIPDPDRAIVSNGLDSGDWNSYIYYPVGSTIYHRNGTTFASQDPLLSAFAQTWGLYQLRWFELHIKPTQTGPLDIYYRRTIFDRFGDMNIAPSTSSYVDQQGWPVRRHRINVVEPPSNQSPAMSFTAPTSAITVQQGDPVTISWTDSDPDNNAYISLAYDTDCSEGGHTWIAVMLREDPDGSGDSYLWQTDDITPGTYRIWGFIYDNENEPVYDCASGTVVITDEPPNLSFFPATFDLGDIPMGGIITRSLSITNNEDYSVPIRDVTNNYFISGDTHWRMEIDPTYQDYEIAPHSTASIPFTIVASYCYDEPQVELAVIVTNYWDDPYQARSVSENFHLLI